MFICKLNHPDNEDTIVRRFINDFESYYRFSDEPSDYVAEISLYQHDMKDIYDAKLDNCDFQLIHNSHSANIKYLLDGSIHTQKNAEKYAKTYQYNEHKKIVFVKDSQSVILIDGTKIEIHGENIYADFVYVFETLLNTYMESIGGIALHAASCSVNDQAIVVCGKSGSGKTSLLFDLIYEKGALFHSNDRIIIYKNDANIFICGIPIPVNVPIKTMKKNSHWTNNEIVSQAEENSKIRFNVNEISKLFNIYENRDLKLDKVFISNYSDCNPKIVKLLPVEAINYLEVLSPYDECHPNWLGVFKAPYNENDCNNFLLSYLEGIDLYRAEGTDLISSVKNEV
jgi:hypothetical protein